MASAFQQFVSDPKRLRIFQQELLAAEVTELMCRTMKETGISRSVLAKQLDKSKGRVSQILASESNLTLRTIADVFTALGKKVAVHAEPICLDEPLPPAQTRNMTSERFARGEATREELAAAGDAAWAAARAAQAAWIRASFPNPFTKEN